MPLTPCLSHPACLTGGRGAGGAVGGKKDAAARQTEWRQGKLDEEARVRGKGKMSLSLFVEGQSHIVHGRESSRQHLKADH